MEWKDVGLMITDSPNGEDAGVFVEQTMDGIRGTNCYRARFWSFKNHGDLIKKFVDACLKRKMVFAIQENHPLEKKRGQNGKECVTSVLAGGLNNPGGIAVFNCNLPMGLWLLKYAEHMKNYSKLQTSVSRKRLAPEET